jgi:hypothetical protein
MDGLLDELDLLDVCALQWRICVESAALYGRSLPSHRYLECRLTDLTSERLSSILDFCGLSHDGEVADEYARLYDPRLIVKRGKNLSPEERKQINDWVEPTEHWINSDPWPQRR